MSDPILTAKNTEAEFFLLPQMANRHGVITGATGTGKTVTLQVLAEGFSRAGVPVFAADIKGDLSGVAEPGDPDFGDSEIPAASSSPPLPPHAANARTTTVRHKPSRTLESLGGFGGTVLVAGARWRL